MNYQQRLLSGAIDNFLRLDQGEERWVIEQVKALPAEEREGIMEIITSWKEEGLQEGALTVILRQLSCRLGDLDAALIEQARNLSYAQLIELGEALLVFSKPRDLTTWLRKQASN